MLFSDFSLTQWKSDKDVNDFEGLNNVQKKQLVEDLGLSPYLNDTQCQTMNLTDTSGTLECYLIGLFIYIN